MSKKIDIDAIKNGGVMKMEVKERVSQDNLSFFVKQSQNNENLFTEKQIETMISIAKKHTEYRKTHPFVRNDNK